MTPACEACGREPATSFSWFAERERWYAPASGTWRFTGACTSDIEQYYVRLHTPARGGFLDSHAEQADWLAHLRGKVWFNPRDFAVMLGRFEQARGALRTRTDASWRTRICFVCGLTIPERQGVVQADLRIMTHQGPCGERVAAERRVYDRSPRGRWRPRREVFARLLQAAESAPVGAGRTVVARQLAARAFRATHLLRVLDELEDRA
jgi:hypothetical protein